MKNFFSKNFPTIIKTSQLFYKYLPDFLIFLGIGILSYVFLSPEKKIQWKTFGFGDNSNNFIFYKVSAILLIVIGINIIIRRYINNKK